MTLPKALSYLAHQDRGMGKRKTSTPYNPRGIRSQREVAQILGISQARVMQVERRALRKLVMRLQSDKELQTAFWDMVGSSRNESAETRLCRARTLTD